MVNWKNWQVEDNNLPPLPAYQLTTFYQWPVYGLAMGSSLGPSLADFFLGYLDELKLLNNPNFNPWMYVQYVDDVLLFLTEIKMQKNVMEKSELVI